MLEAMIILALEDEGEINEHQRMVMMYYSLWLPVRRTKMTKMIEKEEVVEIPRISRMEAKIVGTNPLRNGHQPSSARMHLSRITESGDKQLISSS